jgi:hypothetical protein
MVKQTTIEMVSTEVEKFTTAFTTIKGMKVRIFIIMSLPDVLTSHLNYIDELIQKTNHVYKKNKESISNIKNKIADYFSRYDQALAYIQKRFDNMNATFEDYENNFMTPTKMREGRMHAIESKLKEQDDSIEIEYKHLKMLYQEMLTAFKQSIYVNGSDISTAPLKAIIYSHVDHNDYHHYASSAFNVADSNTITHLKANRTVKESINDKFLPSLNKGIPTKNIEFVKTPDASTINKKVEAKNFKRLSSAKKNNLDDNKAILRQNFNEPIIKDIKKSPRVSPNRSVVVNSDNEVETYDGTTLKAKDSTTCK